ncbi:MAG: tetratricopeptide repeat protein [Candidatus Tumulicola sp.]
MARRLLPSLAIMAVAAIGIVAAPVVLNHAPGVPSAAFTPAPVMRDYVQRDALVSFDEAQAKADPLDQITLRMLALQYMQRFRERFDFTDVTRAENAAQRSLRLQPQGNTPAEMTLGSALLAYHNFIPALAHERAALAGAPYNLNARAQVASVLMELGRYPEAERTLGAIVDGPDEDPTVDSVRARYAELTGHLGYARALIAGAIATTDAATENSAYNRSWFHMRAGQLAFEAGDASAAEAEFAASLAAYPDNAMALLYQARMFRAQKRWHETLAAASRSVELYPLPQGLGYQADAQRALGDTAGARQTDALIAAEERLFDAQGVNDRLLANYYAQRGVHLTVALRAARDDYRRRGDEVYADDTMAWTLARAGRWREARRFARLATRLGTQDSEVQFHAGTIALHNGAPQEARMRLQAALDRNPAFDPFDPDAARAELRSLLTAGTSPNHTP